MKNVTLQEVFDRVVTHLLTQGNTSFSQNSSNCAYRGAGGLMCVVGCLIPDSLYNPLMDSDGDEGEFGFPKDIDGIADHFGLDGLFDFKVTDCSDEDFISFLGELQSVHDMQPPSTWDFRLKFLAAKHNLQFNVL